MSTLKRVKLPSFGGLEDPLPPLPAEEYRSRLELATDRMINSGFDFLAVYGDREHFAKRGVSI
jgi:hypothetical protein